MRMVLGFIAAVIVIAVLGATSNALVNQGEMAAVGGQFSLGDRIGWIVHDITTFGPMLGVIMGVGLLIAFIVAGFVAQLAPGLRSIVYLVAGAVTVPVALYALGVAFPGGITPIASTRFMDGTIGLMIAGALAGLTYTLIKRPA